MKYLSLFSGIEAATVAWEPLGWEPIAFCEIDTFPSALLAYHYPHVPNLGDITKVDWSEYKQGEKHPDIIVGGSPCFPAGALVLTEAGFKNIEEIKIGDKVVSHKGRLQKVLRTGSKIADTIILKDEHGTEIEATPNHPFYSTKNAGEEPVWTKAEDMLGRRWYHIHSLEDELGVEPFSEYNYYALGKWLGGDNEFTEFVSTYFSMTGRDMPSWIFSLPKACKISLLNGYLEEDNFSINEKVSCGMRNLYSRYKDLSNRHQVDAVGYFEEDIIQIKDGRKNIRVYNLEVENDNSYTVNGIAVHNCQSFSYAGKREGLAGESGLMFEYIRAVRKVRPRYFVWENVPGAFSSEKGEAFRQLLSEMDACGYSLAWRVLDAQFFGVPQRRERVFLVGSLGEGASPAEILLESESLRWDFTTSKSKRKELAKRIGKGVEASLLFGIAGNVIGRASQNGGNQIGYCEEDDAFYTLTTVDRHAVVAPYCLGDCNANASCDRDICGTLKVGGGPPVIGGESYQVRRITPLECERLQGFPDDYTNLTGANPEELYKILSNGAEDKKLMRNLHKWCKECSDTPRYKAIGNSMAVPVMRWIGQRIQDCYS